MKTETKNLIKIYFKPYLSLSSLENAIKELTEMSVSDFTVIGKVAQIYSDKSIDDLKNADGLKIYWQKLLGNAANFGSFKNSEIGNIFIAGPLSSTFLGEVNGKTLGTLSAGPYGIMMGMGASEVQAKTFIETLNLNHYLILFRGAESKLDRYINILNPAKS